MHQDRGATTTTTTTTTTTMASLDNNPQTWTCAFCTLCNPLSRDKCDLCGSRRGKRNKNASFSTTATTTSIRQFNSSAADTLLHDVSDTMQASTMTDNSNNHKTTSGQTTLESSAPPPLPQQQVAELTKANEALETNNAALHKIIQELQNHQIEIHLERYRLKQRLKEQEQQKGGTTSSSNTQKEAQQQAQEIARLHQQLNDKQTEQEHMRTEIQELRAYKQSTQKITNNVTQRIQNYKDQAQKYQQRIAQLEQQLEAAAVAKQDMTTTTVSSDFDHVASTNVEKANDSSSTTSDKQPRSKEVAHKSTSSSTTSTREKATTSTKRDLTEMLGEHKDEESKTKRKDKEHKPSSQDMLHNDLPSSQEGADDASYVEGEDLNQNVVWGTAKSPARKKLKPTTSVPPDNALSSPEAKTMHRWLASAGKATTSGSSGVTAAAAAKPQRQLAYHCFMAGCQYAVKFHGSQHPPLVNGKISDSVQWNSRFYQRAMAMCTHLDDLHPDLDPDGWPLAFRKLPKPPIDAQDAMSIESEVVEEEEEDNDGKDEDDAE